MATKAVGATKKVARKKTPRSVAAQRPDAAPRPPRPVPEATAAANDATPEPVAAVPASGEKQKLVRDSFTMPKSDYALLDAMKQRLLTRSKSVRKSELLRAAIATLASMSDDDLLATMDRVPSLKTGRPKKQKDATKTRAR